MAGIISPAARIASLNPESPGPPLNAPLQETDLCVLCGMCLPYCPTFGLTADEGESPRGRLSLMQAFARGQLEPDAALLGHLDRCLVCRACERACPSGVPYGKLIDEARALLGPGQLAGREHPAALRHLLEAVTDKPGRLRPLAKNLRLYQKSGAQWLARHSGLLKGLQLDGLEAMLPAVPAPQLFEGYYPSTHARHGEGQFGDGQRGKEQHGELALFTGCLSEILDVEVLQATIRLLNRLGYAVHVPPDQGCCGALHQHNGDPVTARTLAEQNRTAFAPLRVEAVIGTASGCTAQLFGYAQQWGEDSALPAPVQDITAFLAAIDWPDTVAVRPLQARVAVHEPCSSRNVLRDAGASARLLARIPGLEQTALPSQAQCCGAAGSYLITQPDNARALRQPLLDALDRQPADILVSHNLGCALHLANGLEGVRVVHPVVLLAEQVL